MIGPMLATMLESHFWANKVMLDALEGLTYEQLHQPFQSSFPSLQATLVHMLNSERFLLSNLQGEPLPKLDRESLQSLAGIRAAWEGTEGAWRAATTDLSEQALQRPVTVRFSSGQSFPMQAWQIIHQLLVHTPYHRGQVITGLHQVGAKPFKTDALLYHIDSGRG